MIGQRIFAYFLKNAKRRQRIATLVAGSVCWLSWLAPAQAQTTDPLGAQALFDSAKERLKIGDWTRACEMFQKSMDLEPAVSTLVKIARCREHEGSLASAWYDYEKALKLNRDVDQSERRRQQLDAVIRADIARLKARLPRLRILVTNPPTDLQILRDGQPLPLSAIGEPLPVDPGVHELTGRANGFLERTLRIEVTEGQTANAELALEAAPPKAAPGLPIAIPVSTSIQSKTSPTLPTPTQPSRSPRQMPPGANARPTSIEPSNGGGLRWIGIAASGGGIMLLGVAGYYGLKTQSLISDMTKHCDWDGCDELGMSAHDRAVRARTTGYVLAGLGSAMLVSGLVVYAVSASSAKSDKQSSLALTVGSDSVAVLGAF